MPIKPVDQVGMDETVIEDEELEELLEARQEAKMAALPYAQAVSEADTAAKAAIEERVEVGQIVRVGRFRVSRVLKPGRHVEFDTEAKPGISIVAGDDE